MKKRMLITLIITVMLCGCGNASNTTSSSENSKESQAVSTTAEIDCVWVDDTVSYQSYDELKSAYSVITPMLSDTGTETNEYVPLRLVYDEERFQLGHIIANRSGYEYILLDKESNKNVTVSICNNTDMKEISEVRALFGNAKSIVSTAESGGNTYDVLITTSPYKSTENYSITFLPEEGHYASIHVGTDTTADEILSYFNEFTLVPDEET